MGLFSFLQRSSAPTSERAGVADPVQVVRMRARRRLIGAAVLLGIGIIGFPLLFETQPRPIPVDIPIDIPQKDSAVPLPLPAPRAASAATGRAHGGAADDAAGATTSPTAASPAAAPASADDTAARREPPASPPSAKPAPAPADTPKPAARADDGSRARALLDGQPAAKPAAADADAKPATTAGRFVVQVAAYGEASLARDMRQRIDKLGLKSYTQVVQVDGARRIRVRVGPFNDRDEADKAAGKLKAAGLPAAVLAL